MASTFAEKWGRSALLWGGLLPLCLFAVAAFVALEGRAKMKSVTVALQEGRGRKVEEMPDTSFSSFAPFLAEV
jgi:hypothetical protein